jgi:SAM-dependent methyltransferase
VNTPDRQFSNGERRTRKNLCYHEEVDRLYGFLVPENVRVLELGCSTGRLLSRLHPKKGVGVDIDHHKIYAARSLFKHKPELRFFHGNVENFDWSDEDPFDYIIASDLTVHLQDIQKTLDRLHQVCTSHTRIIVSFHSNLWRPIFYFAALMGRKQSIQKANWLSVSDMKNLLSLSGFVAISSGGRMLLPFKIPLLTPVMNRFAAKLPFIKHLCVSWYVVARPAPRPVNREASVSVLVPTRNEKGNIEAIFSKMPTMGRWTELIFVDGNSSDGTVEAIEQGILRYKDGFKRILLLKQAGKGKGQAVFQGFDQCRGEILMILDSDLTMPAEELPKYYEAIVQGHGEFINGCRLVYPMGEEAMRFLNMVANYAFGHLFSWFLNQTVKDTLCGTKVLWRRDYVQIDANRAYFGDFDPFGDFDLLFGASRLNLKIIDMPIRYRKRTYGDIKIDRFRDGLLLLKMCRIAFCKLKLA